jgi:hypothetical protein
VKTRPKMQTVGTLNTISSMVNDKYYAMLQTGGDVAGEERGEKPELNNHAWYMLHLTL